MTLSAWPFLTLSAWPFRMAFPHGLFPHGPMRLQNALRSFVSVKRKNSLHSMPITSASIAFPILMHGPKGVGLRRFSAREGMIERAAYVKRWPSNGRYRVIAEDLRAYAVKKFVVLGGAFGFGGFRIGGPFIIERLVIFDFELGEGRQLTADEIADFFSGMLEYDESVVASFRTVFLQKLENARLSASSSYDLFQQMANELYKEG